MNVPDQERLHRLLGGDDIRWLVDRLRRRLRQGRPLTGPVTLADATPAQRRAVELLLGRPPGRGASVSVPLDDLDALIRRSGLHPGGLAAAVESLAGPVTPLAAEQAAEAAEWVRVSAPLAAAVRDRPLLRAWYAERTTTGLLRRFANDPDGGERLFHDLARVLHALPADGVPLARFAVAATGDAHALDLGRPLATLALSAIRAGWPPAVEHRSGDSPARDHPGGPAMRRRELWEAVGVLVDEVSSTVLALNLHATPGSRLHRLTAAADDLGEPVVLTLRQLAGGQATLAATEVFVCENPTVLGAAADRLGPASPTLICTGGQPTTAVLRLLGAAVAGDARIRYHGDFDWGGLRIANLLHSRLPWRPWRYDTAAYESAASRGGQHALRGTPTEAAWDHRLAGAMRRHGVRVEEEFVLDDLISDLVRRSR